MEDVWISLDSGIELCIIFKSHSSTKSLHYGCTLEEKWPSLLEERAIHRKIFWLGMGEKACNAVVQSTSTDRVQCGCGSM